MGHQRRLLGTRKESQLHSARSYHGDETALKFRFVSLLQIFLAPAIMVGTQRVSDSLLLLSHELEKKKLTLTDAILRALSASTHFILSTSPWGRHCYTCLMDEKSEVISQDHIHTHTHVLTGGQNSKRSHLQILLAPLFLKTWCDGSSLETAVRTFNIL